MLVWLKFKINKQKHNMPSIILKETLNCTVEKFFEIYKQDRFLARIYAIENPPTKTQLLLNEETRTKFQIFKNYYKYGVSKTLRKYVSKKTEYKIFVNNGKFFKKENNSIYPITINNIDEEIKDVLIKKFSWIRFLVENKFSEITFNSVVRYKLYSRDKVLRHLFKCKPALAIEIRRRIPPCDWKIILKSSTNPENVNLELLSDCNIYLLQDTCRMANRLNEKINLAWSVKRLTAEHDRLSRTYTHYIMKIEGNDPLKISPIYKEFAEFDKTYELIEDSGRLLAEGLIQQHCVASYKQHINSGVCAIFHIKGYTAEIKKLGSRIFLEQFRGTKNCIPPLELRMDLQEKIAAFNTMKEKENQQSEPRVSNGCGNGIPVEQPICDLYHNNPVREVLVLDLYNPPLPF